MTVGIYKIVHNDSGKVYVGSSKNIENRHKNHLYMLKNRMHHSVKLQNAHNKYGGDSFVFETIELCEESDLLVREQYWMDTLEAYSKGYNCSVFSHRPSAKIATKYTEGNAEYIKGFLENMLEIEELKTKVPEDVWVSLFTLNTKPNGMKAGKENALFKRYYQATNIILGVLTDIQYKDPTKEYRLHYITYMKGGEYELSPVVENITKHHDSKKTDDIYTAMIEQLVYEMEDTRFGKYLLNLYKESKETSIAT